VPSRPAARQGSGCSIPFGGSGSTLIAAERTGRLGSLVELDPRYCDVIVARWERFSGRVAERADA
jgi:DNA modification methylase